MKHEIPHDLEMAKARLVARKAVESYAERFEKYGLQPRWTNEDRVELEFDVKGKKLDGALTVFADRLVFEMDVPFLFRVFTGKATEIIDRETRKWIDRAKSGELDDVGARAESAEPDSADADPAEEAEQGVPA